MGPFTTFVRTGLAPIASSLNAVARLLFPINVLYQIRLPKSITCAIRRVNARIEIRRVAVDEIQVKKDDS